MLRGICCVVLHLLLCCGVFACVDLAGFGVNCSVVSGLFGYVSLCCFYMICFVCRLCGLLCCCVVLVCGVALCCLFGMLWCC